MVGKQQLHERHPATLPTAQNPDSGIKIDIGQQMPNDRSCSSVGGPNVIRCAADDAIAYGDVGPDVFNLMQEPDRQLICVGHAAIVWGLHAGQNPQQGGLSGSVTAHDANDFAAAEAETDAVEQCTGAVADADAFGVDQIAH